MKKIILYAVFGLLIVLSSNLMNRYSIKAYNYSTKDFVYTYSVVEAKGRTMEGMLDDFQKWKALEASRAPHKIYRNFKKNYLLFWKWAEYSSSDYYDFPFVERE